MSLNKLCDIKFELKLRSKQLTREAARCEKEQKKEQDKSKRAMMKNNMEEARIFCDNAIRKKKEGLAHLRLSARMDAMCSRLDSAIKTKILTKNMSQIVRSMNDILKTSDPITISCHMDTFEKQFEDMDVLSSKMMNSIGNSVASMTPQEEVNQLMSQVADEHGIDIRQYLNEQLSVNPNAITQTNEAQNSTIVKDDDELEKKFAMLKSQ